LPKSVVNLVYGEPAMISEALIGAPEIRKISFTGSVPVGKHLAELAARQVKPITLELGGHAPVIIFEDADIEAAIKKLIPVKFRTCGQVCSSPTRYFVHSSIATRFVEAFADAARKLRVGNGMDANVDMGPLVSERRLKAVTRLVEDAVARGARIVTGGQRVGERGYFFAPTVLTQVHEQSQILAEEPFGPIVPFQTFDTYEEVVARANHLQLGLSAYAFTRSLKHAQRLADDLECGMLGINTLAVSMAEAPFGGVKESGYGKEGGIEGMEAYLQSKFIAEAID
jgi:succinate-semialdehyde dehydrogenase/glutarate-semialdehyde dehydrogenase